MQLYTICWSCPCHFIKVNFNWKRKFFQDHANSLENAGYILTLFASLITTHKAVVENPEQTRDSHRPNTLVTERVQLSSPAQSLGNQYLVLVKRKDACATNIWQKPMYEPYSTAASSKAPAKWLAAASTCHCTFCSDHWINKNAPMQILYLREGFVLTFGSTLHHNVYCFH